MGGKNSVCSRLGLTQLRCRPSSSGFAGGAGTCSRGKLTLRRPQHPRLPALFSGGAPEPGAMNADPDDSSELSSHITAPGILKVFGPDICEGANYKSVLATRRSSARELVKEALSRYSLSKAHDAGEFVLCEVIGSVSECGWRTECVRLVSDHEKPLLIQSLWKPREGFARRFEIQRKTSLEEKQTREQDTETAGINAQARRLQKSRSRGKSVPADARFRHSRFKSLSETQLTDPDAGSDSHKEPHLDQSPYRPRDLHPNPDPKQTEADSKECAELHPNQNPDSKPRIDQDQDSDTKEETDPEHNPDPDINPDLQSSLGPKKDPDSSQINDSNPDPEIQTCRDSECEPEQLNWIHPPDDCPYLLLLQGYNHRQVPAFCGQSPVFEDPVLYALTSRCTVFGRQPEHTQGAAVQSVCLWAPDLLPCHCSVHREDATDPSSRFLLSALGSAKVKLNGAAVDPDVRLLSGDILALGDHYLFMYKEPWSPGSPLLCSRCSLLERRVGFRDLQGAPLTLEYEPEQESRLLELIFSSEGHSHPLTPGFLVCLCVQRSVIRFSRADLRRLLLKSAAWTQSSICEKAEDLAALPPETSDLELMEALEPMMRWMSNSIQIHHFIQEELPKLLNVVCQEREEQEEERIALLSAREEALLVHEELLMFSFQQCVYYLTKALYALLPAVLDTHSAPVAASGEDSVPLDLQRLIHMFLNTLQKLRDAGVHPQIRTQLFSFLFFFINALLFNQLMERGPEKLRNPSPGVLLCPGSTGGFFCYSSAVQIQLNLDLLLDWTL
ncbi:hypothetical protein DNTS_016188, partial [Danionella cerebrum]